MMRTLNIRIRSKEDIKNNIENIKIYVRGHNLFDIFYGKYHGEEEQKILKNILMLRRARPSRIFLTQ